MEGGYNDVRRNIFVMSIGNTVTTSANSLWIMFMPYFFEDAGITPFFIGIIFTAIAVSRATVSPLGGRIADRYGRKPVIGIGYSIYTIGVFVILVSLTFISNSLLFSSVLAAAGYIILAAGSGFLRPASSMLLVESSPEKRRGLSYMITTRVLPSIPPAILVLIGTSLYINNQFWLAIIIGLFGLIFVLALYSVCLHETLSDSIDDSENSIPPTRLRSDWFLLLLIAAFALDSISSSGLSWYVPIFVGQSNIGLYGLMISVSTLVIAVSALVSGGLVDRIGTQAAIVGGWTLLAITVILFPLGTQPLEILILYSVWAGLDMVDISVPPLAVAEKYPKEKRASIMGVYSMSVSLTSMIGPTLISFALLLGENVPFYIKAIMNLVGAFIFVFATRITNSGEEEIEGIKR